MIEFVTSNGQKLLEVPEGGCLRLYLSTGETMVRTVNCVNDYNVLIGDRLWNPSDMADFMVRNCETWEYEPHPETVQGYMITDRTVIGKKTIVLAHNPAAGSQYVTWQGHTDIEGYDWCHYFSGRDIALRDYKSRVENLARPYREAFAR